MQAAERAAETEMRQAETLRSALDSSKQAEKLASDQLAALEADVIALRDAASVCPRLAATRCFAAH